MIGTFLASEVRILTRILESHHVDAKHVYRHAGLNDELVSQPRARVPFDRVARAWGHVAKLLRDPHIGLEASRVYRATDFYGLAVVFIASPTLRTALERLVRYHLVVNTALSMKLVQTGESLDLACSSPDVAVDAARVIEDARAAILVDVCRTAAHGPLDPLEVAFTYPARRWRTRAGTFRRCAAGWFSVPRSGAFRFAWPMRIERSLRTTASSRAATTRSSIGSCTDFARRISSRG